MDDDDRTIRYMQKVIAWQPRLYAFILSLTGNPNDADDVLQNANVALLQKQKAFRHGASFGAWAMQIARHEVRRYWDAAARTKRRFDDVLIDRLAAGMSQFDEEPSLDLQRLRRCVSILSEQERRMLALRYGGKSVAAIAEKWGRSTGSISQTLYRIRAKLAECVKRDVNAEARDES